MPEALRTLQDHKEAEMVFYIYITEDDNSLVGLLSSCLGNYQSRNEIKGNNG